MPKTDIKKIESEDLAELSDEALDRTAESALLCGAALSNFSFNSAPSD